MSRIKSIEVEEVHVFAGDEVRRAWPVSWSGVWVGALTSFAGLVLLGLIGVALGSHLIGPSPRILSWLASLASLGFGFPA